MLMSNKGTVLRCDVNGKIVMKVFLSGMPDVKLGLNDKLEVRCCLQPSLVVAMQWQSMVSHITAQHHTAQHGTVWHSITVHDTAWHAQSSAAQHKSSMLSGMTQSFSVFQPGHLLLPLSPGHVHETLLRCLHTDPPPPPIHPPPFPCSPPNCLPEAVPGVQAVDDVRCDIAQMNGCESFHT